MHSNGSHINRLSRLINREHTFFGIQIMLMVSLVVFSVIRTFAPVSFGVYILISLPNLQRKVTTKAQVPATNRHTNPPSTRVSLPTDTAEHAPNFLSPSTAEPSEVTPLINN